MMNEKGTVGHWVRNATLAILLGMGAAALPNTASAAPAPYPGGVHWVNIPVRSAAQAAAGMNGGEGGQCIMGMTRCASDDNRIYMTGDMHGVWRSDNGGAFWHPCRSAGLSNNGNSAIAVSPTNHDVVLDYSQSDWQTNRDSLVGIYRSTNGGDTWTRTLTVANITSSGGINRPTLAFAADGTHVYLGSYANGFYRSTDGGATWSGALSLVGATFSKVTVDPTNVNKVWAATGTGLQVSTDGGSTWTVKASSGVSVSDVSVDPVTANRVYYILPGTGLERSNDGGSTWSLVTSSLNSSADRLYQSPMDSNHIILTSGSSSIVTANAGTSWTAFSVDTSKTYNSPQGWNMDGGTVWSYTNVNNVVAVNACLIYASTNAGVNWSDSATGFTGFYHQWSNTTVAFANTDPTRWAMFCDDMNTSLTFDGGSTWFTKGLAAQVDGWWGAYAGDMSPTWSTSPIIVNASGNYFNDDIMRTTTGTTNAKDWTDVNATKANNLFIRFDLQNANIVYADNHRSNDAGQTWTTLTQTVRGMSPSNGSVVYAYSGGNVMKSTDTGTTWTTLPAPPASAAGNIISVDPSNSNVIWAITGSDVSKFNGTSWTSYPASTWVSSTLSPVVLSVNVDPANGNHVVVGLDSNGTSYIFYTTDGGTTWYDITGDAPEIGTGNPIYIQPVTGRIYMGHGFGTYAANLTTPEGGDITPPSAPTNLASPSKTNNTVSLTWTGSTDNVAVRAYDVYVGSYLSGSTMGTSWTVCGLAAGTQYTFKITARDNAGNQTSSTTLNVTTTGGGTIPPPPTGLTATAGDTQVALSWTASTGATSYNVKRSTVSGSGYVTVASPTATSYTNTGLTNGTTYYYVVTAVNATGESGNSNQASATPSGAAPQAQIPNTATAPVIDGTVDSVWSTATAYTLSKTTGTISGASDCSATWKALWDSTNLYVLASVTDDVKKNDSVNVYDDDSVEVYLDADHNGGTVYDANDRQFQFGWGDAAVVEGGGRSTTGVAFAKADPTGTSYVMEIKVPWSNVAFTPAANAIIGVDVHVNDDDDGGVRDGKVIWNDGTDTAWTNPSVFGTGKLLAATGSGNTHGGTWALKGVPLTTPDWHNTWQVASGVATNQTYTASFWMKGSGACLLIVTAGSWGTELHRQQFNATSTWTQYSFTIPTGANTQLTYYFADGTGVPGTLYIDDCFLGVLNGTNVLANPGFESGAASWNVDVPSIWTIVQNP